eukprot:326047_1
MAYIWDKFLIKGPVYSIKDGWVDCNICNVGFSTTQYNQRRQIEIHTQGISHSIAMRTENIPHYALSAVIGEKDDEINSLKAKVQKMEKYKSAINSLELKCKRLQTEKYLVTVFGDAITKIIMEYMKGK